MWRRGWVLTPKQRRHSFVFLALSFSKDSRPPAPTAAPSHITGGLGSFIKIKPITCKDQWKWSIPSLKAWQALGVYNFEQPSLVKARMQASDSQNNIVLTLSLQYTVKPNNEIKLLSHFIIITINKPLTINSSSINS